MAAAYEIMTVPVIFLVTGYCIPTQIWHAKEFTITNIISAFSPLSLRLSARPSLYPLDVVS